MAFEFPEQTEESKEPQEEVAKPESQEEHELPSETPATEETEEEAPDPSEAADSPDEEPEGEEEPDSTGDLEFDGEPVTVDVPEDLRAELSDKGIDVDGVVKELYSGEFGLSEPTLQKLYDAYGKPVVDGYLNGIKATSESNMQAHRNQVEADKANTQKALDAAYEIVGGEEGWGDLEGWAAQNWTDAQFDDFNSVMDSGNQYAIKLALEAAKRQRADSEGVDALDIHESDSASISSNNAPLTSAQYIAGFSNGEANKDPAAWDARRSAGISRGI